MSYLPDRWPDETEIEYIVRLSELGYLLDAWLLYREMMRGKVFPTIDDIREVRGKNYVIATDLKAQRMERADLQRRKRQSKCT